MKVSGVAPGVVRLAWSAYRYVLLDGKNTGVMSDHSAWPSAQVVKVPSVTWQKVLGPVALRAGEAPRENNKVVRISKDKQCLRPRMIAPSKVENRKQQRCLCVRGRQPCERPHLQVHVRRDIHPS